MAIVIDMVLKNEQVLRGVKQVKTGFRTLETHYDRLAKKFNKLRLPNVRSMGLRALNTGINSLLASLARFSVVAVTSFIDVNSQLEQMQIMMETATNSIAAGEKALSDMIKLSINAPFSIDSLANSFVKLKTAGIDPMNGTLQTLVDSVAAFGGSSEQLRLVSIALQQMAGKGVISMEELRRQFGEQVPTAMRAMAAELKMSIFDMLDQIGKGGLLSSKGIPALITGLEKLHGGAAQKRMKSFQGATINLRKQWELLMKSMGDSNGAFSSITDAVNAIAGALQNLRDTKAGQKVIGGISQAIVDMMTKITNNPEVVDDFFMAVFDGAKMALGVMSDLAAKFGGLVAYIDKYSQFSGMFTDVQLAGAGIKQEKITPENYLSVREDLLKLLALQDEFMKNLNNPEYDVSKAKAMIKELQDRINQELDGEDSGWIIDIELNDTEYQAAIDRMRRKEHEFINEDREITFKYEEKNRRSLMSDFELDMEVMLAESRETAEGILENFSKNYDSIAKEHDKLMDKLAKQTNDFFKNKLSYEQEINELAGEGLSDEGAWKSQLALIDDYKKRAEAAFAGGRIDEYNILLEETHRLIKALGTEGITEESTVSDKDIDRQKQLIRQLEQIKNSRPEFSHRRTYQKQIDEAKSKLKELYGLQESGEKTIVSAEEQRIKKMELLLGIHEKLKAAEQSTIDETKDKIKNIDDTIAAMKRLEKKLEDEKDAVDGLTIVWDDHTDQFIYLSELRQKELLKEIALIDKLNATRSGGAVSSDDPGGDINRYAGGPVSANSPYIVGEKGPELFVPSSNGNIIPNDQLKGSGATEIVLNFNGNKVGPMFSTKQIAKDVLREFEIMQGALS